MSFNFFKSKNSQVSYNKRPFDSYKSLVEKLDEDTKRKIDKQRQYGMIIVVVFVALLVIILAVTGIGIDRSSSRSGNVFVDKESVLIECFGDSVTEGFTLVEEDGSTTAQTAQVTYPDELEKKLPELLAADDHTYQYKTLTVKNYGQSGSILQENSSSRLSGSADIVIILYTANNFINGSDYLNTLEANIESIRGQGGCVFLMTYPICEGSRYEDKIAQANNYIRNTAEDLEVPLIDLNTSFAGITDYTTEELFAADQEHLTDLGYTIMGDLAAEAIHQYYYAIY